MDNGYNVQPYVMPQMVQPINCDEAMQLTTVNDLERYAQGTVVRLPDFADGQPFIAKLRRPSMLSLAKNGRIPNNLLGSAGELFTKGGGGALKNANDQSVFIVEMYEITRIICDASLVSPTMQEIERAGIELSDDQIMSIFNYSQTGVRALQDFRKK